MNLPEGARISLRYEVECWKQAVDGARLLHDNARLGHLFRDADERPSKEAVAGILALVSQRMDLVERVIAGGADPTLMAAPHNTVISESEDNDLYIQRRDGRSEAASGPSAEFPATASAAEPSDADPDADPGGSSDSEPPSN